MAGREIFKILQIIGAEFQNIARNKFSQAFSNHSKTFPPKELLNFCNVVGLIDVLRHAHLLYTSHLLTYNIADDCRMEAESFQ